MILYNDCPADLWNWFDFRATTIIKFFLFFGNPAEIRLAAHFSSEKIIIVEVDSRVYILKGGALTLKERERAVILGSHSKSTNEYRRNHTQIINKTDKFPPITIFNHL